MVKRMVALGSTANQVVRHAPCRVLVREDLRAAGVRSVADGAARASSRAFGHGRMV